MCICFFIFSFGPSGFFSVSAFPVFSLAHFLFLEWGHAVHLWDRDCVGRENMMLSTPFSRLGRPLLLRFAVLVISMPILQIMPLWLYCLSLWRMHMAPLMLLSSVHGPVRRLCPSPTQVLMSNHVIISLSRGTQELG